MGESRRVEGKHAARNVLALLCPEPEIAAFRGVEAFLDE